jgi:molybdopterin converting factor small subunit
MRVQVKFYADLKNKYARGNRDGIVELVLKENSDIKDVFERLGIDDREIGFIILNEKKVQKDATIADGDLIEIFSFVAGG